MAGGAAHPKAGAAIFAAAGTLLDGTGLRPSAFAARHRGERLEDAEAAAARRFRRTLAPRLRWDLVRLADEHRAAGRTVVLATSASRPQAAPIAHALGAEHVLCTELEVDGAGKLTGRVDGRAVWGPAKLDAVRDLGVDLGNSWAYAGSGDDLPLLEAVGHPVAVAPDGRLGKVAAVRGWDVLTPPPPPGEGGRLARSVGFWGGIVAGMGAGVALGALNRSQRALVDVGLGAGAAIGLAAAGVRVEVSAGREHLFSARPCVFVFNHQSQLDVPVLVSLLQSGYTGVGKAEVKNMPIIGQFMQLAGMTFVGRTGDGRDAEALAPAVAKLRDEGICLAIAPEGTRSPTPRIGRFKTGAVRIAQEAGVPIVPIVIRNAGELMARDSAAVRPGVVEVAVLEPFPITGDDPRAQTDALQERVAATLADWPAGG